MTTRRAARYSRVSTDNQGKDARDGLPRQDRETLEYLAKNDFSDGGMYADTISGTTVTRRAFERLKSEIDRYDVVVISSVDRLARNMAGAFRLLSELLELGVEVHSADMGIIDVKDDADIMNFTMRAMSAHLQHSSIRRNTYSARLAMASRGLNPSGTRNYGYLTAQGKAFIHPEQAPVVRRIFDLAASGVSYRLISDTLNGESIPPSSPERTVQELDDAGELKTTTVKTAWHTSTISHLVRNPVYYQGFAAWREHRLPVPALIDAETWRRAQKRVGRPSSLGWVLTGHLRCGYCGRRMSGIRSRVRGGIQEKYRCQSAQSEHRTRCCFGMARTKLEARVEAKIRTWLSNPDAVRKLLRHETSDPNLADKLADLEAQHKQAFTFWQQGILDDAEFAETRRAIALNRSGLMATAEPEPHPVEAYLELLADMPLAEILDILPLSVTVTRESEVLSV